MIEFEGSKLYNISIERGIPITELILKTSYTSLNRKVTILGVSPISEHVVKAALISAQKYRSPLMFIASLNQVDYDGGYTQWTPRIFIELVRKIVHENNIDIPVIIGLDHCGPWLKDKHVIEGFNLSEAMEDAKKSLREAILAGYDIIHIDTTVEMNKGEYKGPEAETVARRSLELIEYAEEIRKDRGLPPLNYEVGSDRWIYKDVDHVREVLRLILKGIQERGLNDARILFVVGDVGTRVSPNNYLDVDKASVLVNIAKQHGLFVKAHSADYIQNPEEFPKIGVAGANIGPMFADLMFKFLKELVVLEEELYKNRQIESKSEIISVLLSEIINDGRWKKYVNSSEELFSIIGTPSEYIVGLNTRYIINRPIVRNSLRVLFNNLLKNGIRAENKLIEHLSEHISHYIVKFNLADLTTSLLSVLR